MTSPFFYKHHFFKYRVTLFLSIIPIFIVGLSSEFYTGPGRQWFNNYFGDFLYQIFLILLISFFCPKMSPLRVALGVFIFNSAIEFFQLWQPPSLQAIRHTLFGRLFLGYSFVWEDFLYYAIGCTLGFILVHNLKAKARRNLHRASTYEK
ncbi:MAG TPA: DUF2809 domain-containing protein [Leptolyngbyaceae cyanobacterium]